MKVTFESKGFKAEWEPSEIRPSLWHVCLYQPDGKLRISFRTEDEPTIANTLTHWGRIKEKDWNRYQRMIAGGQIVYNAVPVKGVF